MNWNWRNERLPEAYDGRHRKKPGTRWRGPWGAGWWLLLALVLCPNSGWAGGSGLNIVVVVNQASSNSVALGNYYCERRQVPPQNLLRIEWNGGNTTWSRSQYEATLLAPLRAMVTNRGLLAQVDYVVLSMDIPYRVSGGSTQNSTTSVLFYGFKTNTGSSTCELPDDTLSSYALGEAVFRQNPPLGSDVPFLATMLTGRRLDLARALVDQGVNSDGRFPQQTVLLEKTSDTARNVRFFSFDNAVFDMRINGRFPLVRTNSDATSGLTNLLGLQTGLATLTLSSNAFVAGAMGDSLTSYAGELFETSGQTTLFAFTEAGAAGSYGTVTEPCNYQEKFPNPLNYFFQARGFSVAECYYLSLQSPYQGLIVGEPLAAPFARPASGRWIGLNSNAVLAGSALLSVEFAGADSNRPMQQIDLFVDGTLFGTLTNIAPMAGNSLSVTLNGRTASYIVPAGATLQSVTEGLTAALNAPDFMNSSRVRAFATGDRIELDSTAVDTLGAQIPVTATSRAGAATALTTLIASARADFLDSAARGWRSWEVSGTAGEGEYLQASITKTNGEVVVVGVTNTSASMTSIALARQLLALINATSALTQADGVSSEDTYANAGGPSLTFLLFARTPGLRAAQIQVKLTCSENLAIVPTSAMVLDENVGDLRPRNHLYLTAGVTNLVHTFTLDTQSFADGYHELTAVAYEGSHVRTQTRATQPILIRNSSLEATLASSASLGIAALSDTLLLTVKANSLATEAIELFTTGGSAGVASNAPSASFSLAAAQLGEGLHPFYAVVSDTSGNRYRTATLWIRLSKVPALGPFPIQATGLPLRLVWPAVAGYDYSILSADGLSSAFSLRTTLSATNTGPTEWIEPDITGGQRFYQIRATQR